MPHNFLETFKAMFLFCSFCLHPVVSSRSPAVTKITKRTGCQQSSRSSKVTVYCVIRKPICNFLLVIN